MARRPPRETRVVIAAGEAMRGVFRDGVGLAGLEVAAECGDSSELLAAVAAEHPDVVVVDRELRGGSLAALAAITAERRSPKVLMIGGRGARAEVNAARLAGAADCLPVDVDAEQLATAVAALARTEKEAS
jgi:DNA-binding NarL/FixJ family response regulator